MSSTFQQDHKWPTLCVLLTSHGPIHCQCSAPRVSHTSSQTQMAGHDWAGTTSFAISSILWNCLLNRCLQSRHSQNSWSGKNLGILKQCAQIFAHIVGFTPAYLVIVLADFIPQSFVARPLLRLYSLQLQKCVISLWGSAALSADMDLSTLAWVTV